MNLAGRYILVKTNTKNNTFGDCVYKITGDIEDVEELGTTNSMIKCIMVGGTGPAARSGFEVWDKLSDLENAIQEGKTHTLLSDDTAKKMIEQYKPQDDPPAKPEYNNGFIEL